MQKLDKEKKILHFNYTYQKRYVRGDSIRVIELLKLLEMLRYNEVR